MSNTVNSKFHLIVFQLEFDKTRWSCPWNSDQNCTQNSPRGGGGQGIRGGRVGMVGVKHVGGGGCQGGREG